ncbi:MAG: hypothetical protein ACYCUF_04605, partial [Acidimicrobiales bacterium]
TEQKLVLTHETPRREMSGVCVGNPRGDHVLPSQSDTSGVAEGRWQPPRSGVLEVGGVGAGTAPESQTPLGSTCPTAMQNLALVQEMPRGEAYVTEPVAESVFTASEKGPESCQRSPFHTAVNPLEDEFVAGS